MKERITDFVEKEKVVELDKRDKAVFVGDTHGDLEASEKIWDFFRDEVIGGQTYLVFLGDYVDRGAKSKENIDFLLSKKRECSNGIILLLGNHEAYHLKNLTPADFWKSLGEDEYDYYKDLLSLPWIAETRNLAAMHGALPFVSNLSYLKNSDESVFEKENEVGFPIWVSVTWGDLNYDISGAQIDPLTCRPQFGKEIFLKYMQKLGWNILIRSHQPGMQGWSFSNNVLTIFTSQAYVDMNRAQERSIAVVDLRECVERKRNIEILSLKEF